uniref:Uncharacterized protein n=1 Tax=Rhodnius prolixus TaxID=13249 RepID=T1HT12_RHOPR
MATITSYEYFLLLSKETLLIGEFFSNTILATHLTPISGSEVSDASGRYADQFFFGNDFWLGSKNLCLFLKAPFPTSYHLARFTLNMGPEYTPRCMQMAYRVFYTIIPAALDESRFALYAPDGRRRVYRRPGERYAPCNISGRLPFGGGSVMVWAGISKGA